MAGLFLFLHLIAQGEQMAAYYDLAQMYEDLEKKHKELEQKHRDALIEIDALKSTALVAVKQSAQLKRERDNHKRVANTMKQSLFDIVVRLTQLRTMQ
jgi:uncharacterized membrane protein